MVGKLKFLFYSFFFCVLVYFCFIHRSREVCFDLKTSGLSIIEDVRDIDILGYGVYNPGVVSYKDGYLVAHREKAKNFLEFLYLKIQKKRRNVIKITEIDSDFNQKIRSVQLIPRKQDKYCKVTDPRLFWHNTELYMIFCDHTKGGSTQNIGRLKKIEGKWVLENTIELQYDGGEEFYQKKICHKRDRKKLDAFFA